MKKIIYLAVAALVCVSCDSFLETENITKKDTTNFPKTVSDADNMLTGIYATLSQAGSSPDQSYFFVSEMASDDRFGGGGENDKTFQASDHLMNSGPDQYKNFWTYRYRGIFRANMAFTTIDNCEIDEDTKNVYKGEFHFLRGYFYHELAEMFGEVPLMLTPEAINIPRTNIDLVYGQIAYDLKQAIQLLPSTKYSNTVSGKMTKWGAEALMARVFLFYTGFYGKSELPLGDGTGEANSGTVTKSEVTAWIDDCIANSGHSLVDDYRRLWTYSNPHTAKDYEFVKDMAESGKTWILDGSTNPEHIFVVKHSTMGGWGNGFANRYCLYFGLRNDNGFENTFPFGQGWGAGPVNSTLWNEWEKAEPEDTRRKASIAFMDDECPGYMYGQDTQMDETGYWQKKYIAIRAYDSNNNLRNTFASLMWSVSDDFSMGHVQDLSIIRFADVLLMQSELKENADGINQVRARVNLPPVSYSLAALQQERRFELAFEGRRWADIRRWGIAGEVLGKQTGVSILNRGVKDKQKDFGSGYTNRYNETKGFFPLPYSEIELSAGVLTQTPGWGGTEHEYHGW